MCRQTLVTRGVNPMSAYPRVRLTSRSHVISQSGNKPSRCHIHVICPRQIPRQETAVADQSRARKPRKIPPALSETHAGDVGYATELFLEGRGVSRHCDEKLPGFSDIFLFQAVLPSKHPKFHSKSQYFSYFPNILTLN